MAVYTLNGSGTQALSANVSQVRVEILTLPKGASVGHAVPSDYFGVGFVRFGVQGSYLRKEPIDGFDILIDVPPGATTIGYYLFPAGSIRVTEQFAAAVANWQKQPWDRNPGVVAYLQSQQLIANAGTSSLGSYTVPAGRILRISALNVFVTLSTPTTSTNGAALTTASFNGSAGLQAAIYGNRLMTDRDSFQAGGAELPAGTQLVVTKQNLYPDANSAHQFELVGYLFDA